MPRPTYIRLSHEALLHNVAALKKLAPHAQLVAIVKANAYGCGVAHIIPTLEGRVDHYGVASLSEALTIHLLGTTTPCLILQGVFEAQEWPIIATHRFECVIHQQRQLEWLLQTKLPHPVKIWVKLNTGMNRLGFLPDELSDVFTALRSCPWVDSTIVLMTHFACADEPAHPLNAIQKNIFFNHPLVTRQPSFISLKNSAALFADPTLPCQFIRPGLSLYGISPFTTETGCTLGLRPVMTFLSTLTQIFSIQPGETVGYGATWQAKCHSKIGVVAAGYGDGYPRHLFHKSVVFINGQFAPIVGHVSMDTLTVDVTEIEGVTIGDAVELWGQHVPIEHVAKAAGTIPYELMVQLHRRS